MTHINLDSLPFNFVPLAHLAKARDKLVEPLKSHYTVRLWTSQIPPEVQDLWDQICKLGFQSSTSSCLTTINDIYSHFNKSILISRNGCIWIDTGNTVKGGVVAFQVLTPRGNQWRKEDWDNWRLWSNDQNYSTYHNSMHSFRHCPFFSIRVNLSFLRPIFHICMISYP